MSLKQDTFEHLMSLEKQFIENEDIRLGGSWTKELISTTSKDRFQFDYRNSKIEFRKYSFNKRVRTSVVMVRYCSLKRHTNPDGTAFDGPHFHKYQEGFGDKIALRVEDVLGIDPAASSKEDVLTALMKYCNIVRPPNIQTMLEAP
jgi:hypothetical protein